MKRRIVALLMGSLLVTALAFTGCGKAETAATEEQAAGDTQAVENVEEDATDDGTPDSEDAAEDQDPMEYLDGRYMFYYHPADFTAFEQEDHGCILSYTNETVETAGSNTISIYIAYNTTYEQAIADVMSNFGVTDYEVTEGNFGADGLTSYSVVYAPEASEGSGLKTSDTIIAVPDGEDVIVIDVFNTLSPDEGVNMTVSDAGAYVLDTFALMDTE